MPHLYSIPEDILLPTKIVTPPRGSSSPSPPTSGFPEFIPDGLETMGARSSNRLTNARGYEDEEIDFTQLYQEGSSVIRDTQPLGSSSTVTEDRDYDDGADNRKPSKYNVKPPPTKADINSPLTVPRSLRKRTLQQTVPFKFEKHQHSMTKKTGKNVNTENVEMAVKEEMGEAPTQPAKKKARTAGNNAATSVKLKDEPDSSHEQGSSRNRSLSSAVSIDGLGTSLPAPTQRFDPTRAILRVRLNNFAGGAATPITLSECDDNGKLMNFINETVDFTQTWEFSFSGKKFAYAIASFPWLTEASNILLRPGLAESFSAMVTEIENAPIWTEGDHIRCHVEVTIYVL